MGRGMLLAATGVIVGVALSVTLSRSLESVLFEVAVLDAATYVAVVAALVATAGLANWLPARLATRVDPARVLRDSVC